MTERNSTRRERLAAYTAAVERGTPKCRMLHKGSLFESPATPIDPDRLVPGARVAVCYGASENIWATVVQYPAPPLKGMLFGRNARPEWCVVRQVYRDTSIEYEALTSMLVAPEDCA